MKKTIMLVVLMLISASFSNSLVQSNANSMMGDNVVLNDVKDINKNVEIIDSTKIEPKFEVVEKIESRILYKNVKGTVYHAVPSQTDNTPFITADNSFIDTSKVNELRWVALSRDLLKRRFTDPRGKKHVWSGKIKLGDTIWVDYSKKDLWNSCGGNKVKYERMKAKCEQVKGYWIVHDVMGTQYTRRKRSGELILDENGNKQIVKIYNAIDFLQHPEDGMMDVWNRNLIISKRKVKYITLPIDDAVTIASK